MKQPSLFDNHTVIKGSYNGLPYEGPPIFLQADDPAPLQPKLEATAKARVFHLGDAEQLADYNVIIQRMADGTAVKSVEEIKYNETAGAFDVFLRWLEFKYIAPEEMDNG